ncbi:DNA primase catalytic subunit PriS [Methanoculleus sp. Afa-1]|uniref:DNA primase small subunit PriS n=1 Tax=Methanoculleus formosensis TaxID=2590886 RepID=A0A9E4ZKT5_9EURY|nr:DNA primase small subunit PriS [Methanoculleus sp. Afa-1]MCT8336969.1 DNA primase catalytic subunit PriS [Methanoculleus sp. Afa-1]
MKPATLEFVKQRFAGYYQRQSLTVPSSLEQREWGFVFFDAAEVRMRRHMAFADPLELGAYVKNLVPAHVYYSTAYYQTPSAPTMNEKHWAGADLIFDLDADQIVRGPYAMMLARVKEETGKLLAMLTDELGFARSQIRVAFSGGRGYHIHVTEIAVRGWSSQERREIIDYVCGIGLDPAVLFTPAGGETGWRRRYAEALRAHLSGLAALDSAEATAYLSGLDGIGKRTAAEFFAKIESHAVKPPQDLLKDRVVRAITAAPDFEERLRDAGARADEPVTTDIKRLIRTPGSLHGGSGMRVVPLDLRDFAEFDPLVDAVVFGDRDVRVDLKAAFTTSLLGNTYSLKAGVQNVPEALAIFLCCRGMAEIAGGAW